MPPADTRPHQPFVVDRGRSEAVRDTRPPRPPNKGACGRADVLTGLKPGTREGCIGAAKRAETPKGCSRRKFEHTYQLRPRRRACLSIRGRHLRAGRSATPNPSGPARERAGAENDRRLSYSSAPKHADTQARPPSRVMGRAGRIESIDRPPVSAEEDP
jgi:hypothetical protein